MTTFLGVDGGGTKTEFLLIDATGRILAAHRSGPAYYLEIGLEGLREMLSTGIRMTLNQGSPAMMQPDFAFLGLPAYGEDSSLRTQLGDIVADCLPMGRYRCDNDMVCGWAGALAGRDGINVVAGTGSIAYGEFQTRRARAGGWGELFSDEGSAYWIAREGLALFSQMSDGRLPRTALYELVRSHFQLPTDLDLCARVYGPPPLGRSSLASIATLISGAAHAGDAAARQLFERAAVLLASLVHAVRKQIGVPDELSLPVSCSGGMFRAGSLLPPMFEAVLKEDPRSYELVAPRLPPVAGAALYAARLAGIPLDDEAVELLARSVRAGSLEESA